MPCCARRMAHALVALAVLATECRAQTNRLFQWQFANNFVSTSLPTCQDFQIVVKSFNADNSTRGTPPYYMMALEVGGVPTTTLLGSDESNLRWTVNHAANTKLFLSVVDTNGSAGGIPPRAFSVVTGQTTQCLNNNPPTANQSAFSVVSNITENLETCQPWGLSITGGIPPYTVTLAALNSPVVTNVTLGPEDDHYTYINRADPNVQMVAAISDLTGRFATGTPLVKTYGSENYECVGLVSSSGNSAEIRAQEEAAAAERRRRQRTNIIIGVVVGVVGAVGLAAAAIFFMRRHRRRSERRSAGLDQDVYPRKFEEAAPVEVIQFPSYNSSAFGNPLAEQSTPMLPRSPKHASHFSHESISDHRFADAPAFDPYNVHQRESQAESSSGSASASLSPQTVSTRRFYKAQEAYSRSRPGSSQTQVDRDSMRPTSSGSSAGPGPGQFLSPGAVVSEDGEIVYQHRDGGVVRELPPPYLDRAAQARS